MLQALASPLEARSVGRPRARVEAIRQFILQSSSRSQAPAYWQNYIEAEKRVPAGLRAELEAKTAAVGELQKVAAYAPKHLMKRTCVALTTPSTKIRAGETAPRKYKNMTYGVDVQQFFINVAAVGNVPPRSLEPIVREFYRHHFPQLTEGVDYEIPTTSYINSSGWMAGYQAEVGAAWEYGEAEQACVGMDGSTKDNFHLMNSNCRIRTREEIEAGEKGRDVVMRGPTIAPKGNGTGGAESQRDFHLESLRQGGLRLDEVRAVAEELGADADQIPDASEVTNAKTVATINDGEATAKKAARLVRENVPKAAMEDYLKAQGLWDDMTAEEREVAKSHRTHELPCHDHVRALFPGWGMKLEAKKLHALIGEEIEQLASAMRIDGKVSSFNYAAMKECKDQHDAVHYNQAKLFYEYMAKEHPGVPLLDTGRGKTGSRFDGEVEAGFVFFFMRPYIVRFVASRIVGSVEGQGGKVLESALFAQGSYLELAAANRARAEFFDKLDEPMRWLQKSNKSTLTQVDMSRLYDIYVKLAKKMIEDPAWVLEPGLLPELSEAYPELIGHDAQRMAATCHPPGKLTDASGRPLKAKWVAEVRAELYKPTDETNQDSTDLTLKEVPAGVLGPGDHPVPVEERKQVYARGRVGTREARRALRGGAEGSARRDRLVLAKCSNTV